MSPEPNLPSLSENPSLLDWLETFFPFKLPRIPFAQTAKNFDKAVAAIVLAGGENVATRIQASTTHIDAKSAAEKTFIEHGQASIPLGSPELTERALNYALGDFIAAQKNRETILLIATDHINTNSPQEDAPEPIDDDWLNAFKRFAETKSNADIQQLWARILSTEIRKPGSTSLRTLNFLSTVSMADAKKIVDLFSFVLDGQFIPQWVHESKRLSYSQCFALQEIGIISGVYGVGGPATDKPVTLQTKRESRYAVNLEYYGQIAIFETEDPNFHLNFPTMVLTEIGRNLFTITDTKQADYEYFTEFVTQLGKEPIKRICAAIISARSGQQLQVMGERNLYPKP